eukprot:1157000-Pelagomonas_calceolata.AAC.3
MAAAVNRDIQQYPQMPEVDNSPPPEGACSAALWISINTAEAAKSRPPIKEKGLLAVDQYQQMSHKEQAPH